MRLLKNLINQNNIINIFLFLASFNYIFFLARFFDRQNGYILGDWLINYEGGFTRRGLSGFVITNLSNVFKVDLIYLTFFIVCFVYLLFIFFFKKLLNKKKLDFYLLILLFSPATILFNIYDPLSIGRKEILFFLFFLIYLNLKRSKQTNIFLGIFSAVVTLMHEMFFLLMPFFFINRYLSIKSLKLREYSQEVFVLIGAFIPSLIIFFYSNPDVFMQCKYIMQFGLKEDVCWSILDTKRTESFQIAHYITSPYYFYYWLFFSLIIIPISFSLLKLEVKKISLFFVIFLSFLPLFFLFLIVNDWGRYLHVYAVLWSIIIFNLNLLNQNVLYERIKGFSFFCILFFSLSWYMPHCCTEIHFAKKKYNPGIVYILDRIKFRISE